MTGGGGKTGSKSREGLAQLSRAEPLSQGADLDEHRGRRKTRLRSFKSWRLHRLTPNSGCEADSGAKSRASPMADFGPPPIELPPRRTQPVLLKPSSHHDGAEAQIWLNPARVMCEPTQTRPELLHSPSKTPRHAPDPNNRGSHCTFGRALRDLGAISQVTSALEFFGPSGTTPQATSAGLRGRSMSMHAQAGIGLSRANRVVSLGVLTIHQRNYPVMELCGLWEDWCRLGSDWGSHAAARARSYGARWHGGERDRGAPRRRLAFHTPRHFLRLVRASPGIPTFGLRLCSPQVLSSSCMPRNNLPCALRCLSCVRRATPAQTTRYVRRVLWPDLSQVG